MKKIEEIERLKKELQPISQPINNPEPKKQEYNLTPKRNKYSKGVNPQFGELDYFPKSMSPNKQLPTFRGLKKAMLINYKDLPFKPLVFKDGMFYGDTEHAPNQPYQDKALNPDFRPNYGMFLYNSGCLYVGEFNLYIPEGWGYFYTPWGKQFYGEVVKGLAHGKGIFFSPENSNFFYNGEFREGRMHGKGCMAFKGEYFEVVMIKGKITLSTRVKYNVFISSLPKTVKSHEQVYEFLSFFLNPMMKTINEVFE